MVAGIIAPVAGAALAGAEAAAAGAAVMAVLAGAALLEGVATLFELAAVSGVAGAPALPLGAAGACVDETVLLPLQAAEVNKLKAKKALRERDIDMVLSRSPRCA